MEVDAQYQEAVAKINEYITATAAAEVSFDEDKVLNLADIPEYETQFEQLPAPQKVKLIKQFRKGKYLPKGRGREAEKQREVYARLFGIGSTKSSEELGIPEVEKGKPRGLLGMQLPSLEKGPGVAKKARKWDSYKSIKDKQDYLSSYYNEEGAMTKVEKELFYDPRQKYYL